MNIRSKYRLFEMTTTLSVALSCSQAGLGEDKPAPTAPAVTNPTPAATSADDGKSAATANTKTRFDIPVWHLEARWSAKPERFIATGATSFLGGPADEATWSGNGPNSGRCGYGGLNGPYGCTSYDPLTGRFHVAAGAARGLLDGPFSRARFGGGDYSHRSRGTSSPDGRYVFVTEPYFRQVLRRLDLVEQVVKTVPLEIKGIGGMAADSQGRLLVLVANSDRLVFINASDGKPEKELKLDMQEKVGGATFPCSLTLDEINGRLFGSGYGSKKWYVWYWDFKDGSFHGVLPMPQQGEAKRKRNECGPFEGTDLYNEMGSFFGPDDPQKRFLYVTPNDTLTFFRLDLEKREIWGCSKSKEDVRFIGSGIPGNLDWGTRMTPEGDIVSNVPHWNGARLIRFARVK